MPHLCEEFLAQHTQLEHTRWLHRRRRIDCDAERAIRRACLGSVRMGSAVALGYPSTLWMLMID
jgi:hypothetical protein